MIGSTGRRNVREEYVSRKEASMVQARYSDSQLRALDAARFCQKTDAINRRINVIYFWGLGHTQLEATRLANVSPNTLRKSAAAFA
ncbi:MAG: hypothetical protein ACP5I8_15625, partial [Phycisphaerae bacterium]